MQKNRLQKNFYIRKALKFQQPYRKKKTHTVIGGTKAKSEYAKDKPNDLYI